MKNFKTIFLVACMVLVGLNSGALYLKLNMNKTVAEVPQEGIAQPFVIYQHDEQFDPNKVYGGISKKTEANKTEIIDYAGWESEWETSRN